MRSSYDASRSKSSRSRNRCESPSENGRRSPGDPIMSGIPHREKWTVNSRSSSAFASVSRWP